MPQHATIPIGRTFEDSRRILSIATVVTSFKQSALHPENYPDEVRQLLRYVSMLGPVNVESMPRAEGLSDEDCATYRVKGIPIRFVRQYVRVPFGDDFVDGWQVRLDVLYEPII